MEGEPTAVRVQGRSDGPRGPRVVVAVLAAFLVIAILKPWSFGGDGSTGVARPAPVTSTPSAAEVASASPPIAMPTAAPEIDDPNAMPCLTDSTDQVVMIERWAGHEVRSWVAAVDLTDAVGPLDPRLVPVTIFSSHVIGLGVCAPRDLAGSGPPAAELRGVMAIVMDGDGSPMAVCLGPPEPITWPGTGPEPAVLYGAPAVADPTPPVTPAPVPGDSASPSLLPYELDDPLLDVANAPWPAGEYALRFRFSGDAPGVLRWLRIELKGGAAGSG